VARYILKRVLISIPVLIGVVFVIFFMLNVVPGDPVTLMMGEHIKPDLIEAFRERMGLDDPFIVQFFNYLKNAVQGDFGMSYKLNREVSGLIFQAFPHTLKLTLWAALVAWIIGIPAGILSAENRIPWWTGAL